MKKSTREYAVGLLTAMMVHDRAERENRTFTEVFSEFRKSDTYESLLDPGTGLWMNGPDYLSDEYDLELKRSEIQ